MRTIYATFLIYLRVLEIPWLFAHNNSRAFSSLGLRNAFRWLCIIFRFQSPPTPVPNQPIYHRIGSNTYGSTSYIYRISYIVFQYAQAFVLLHLSFPACWVRCTFPCRLQWGVAQLDSAPQSDWAPSHVSVPVVKASASAADLAKVGDWLKASPPHTHTHTYLQLFHTQHKAAQRSPLWIWIN